MRTHKAVGVSVPQEMYDHINRLAESEGLKRSAWVQQQMIKIIKEHIKGITTEEIMGTPEREPKPKLTPAQRVALAKLEMAKKAKRKK